MIVYLIFFLIIPETAFAWGPGTHIEIALSLLEKAALFAPAVRAIIAGREEWFIYGNVAADIIVGKKYAGSLHHCHNWRVGRDILHAARTDRERASAYGYLSHLASDIISHNYYIPLKMIENYRARLLSHTYWEMRFDLHVKQKAWSEMTKMIIYDFSPFDRLLEKTLRQALFSFKTSKTIFSGILALHRFKQFRQVAGIHAATSRFKLDKKECSHYMRLAVNNAAGYLLNPEIAECLKDDPTGDNAIEYAKRVRRELRRLKYKIAQKYFEEAKKYLYGGLHLCSFSIQKP